VRASPKSTPSVLFFIICPSKIEFLLFRN
jgi:hypothetical protein